MTYVMHRYHWDEHRQVHYLGECAEEPPTGIEIYVQDAIDMYDAEGCPVCLPDPDVIAQNVWMNERR